MSISESIEEDFSRKPAKFSFDNQPKLLSNLSGKQIASLVSGPSCYPEKYFWRNIAWSPDGTHLLCQSDDHHLDLFKLQKQQEDTTLIHIFSIYAPTTLLSFAWYPFARQDDPQTWCFAIGARDVTIKLIDAYQGRTRATYGIIDHIERFKGPQSMAFSLDGRKLYCAHDSFLSIISLDNVGTNTHPLIRLTPSSRATRKGKAAAGQKGTVGIYHIKDETITDAEQLCLLGWREEGSNGIAQISFHPTVPHILFLNSRRNSIIRAYDLRYIGSRKSFIHPAAEVALIGKFECQSNENRIESQQRIHFHLDWAGRYLISGNTVGEMSVWDVQSPESELGSTQDSNKDHFFGRILRENEDAFISPLARWKVAEDVIPSIAFHPILPIVVVASGSRYWDALTENDIEDENEKSLSYTVPDAALRLFNLTSDVIM